jgi:hypothetical protein
MQGSRIAHVISVLTLTSALGLLSAGPASAQSDGTAQLLLPMSPQAHLQLPAHAKAGSGSSGRLNHSVFAAHHIGVVLPDDTRIVAVRDQEVLREGGDMTWVGHIDGSPGSLLVLTSHRSAITGYLHHDSKVFEIMPAGPGSHALYEIDQARLPPDGHRHPLLEELAAAAAAAASGDGSAPTSGVEDFAVAGSGFVQDLLVVYTTESKNRYGQAGIESMIQSAVTAANQAYANSQINQSLNLVHMEEVSYAETGDMGVALSRLQSSSDGFIDNVHQLRSQYGADLVAMVNEDANYCGIAYVMSPESSGFAGYAFSVTYSSCLSNQTLAHEIGHNQGDAHDRANSNTPGAFAYSYGHRRCMTDGTGFRTIMSYSNGCSGGTRINNFSNPNVLYGGFATGISYEIDPANSADNARSMNNTADTVAAFRIAAATTPPAAPTALGAVAGSSSQINLNWSDNASDESGFRIERSADGVAFAEVATVGANVTSYSSTGLSASTWYWYRVRAYNGAGNSAYTNVASAQTQTPAPPPAAPSGLTASALPKMKVQLNWADNSSTESGFKIERSLDQVSWTQIATPGVNVTGYTAGGHKSGKTYYYRVRAWNASGDSAWSNTASATARR